jgi:hypothetical protein
MTNGEFNIKILDAITETLPFDIEEVIDIEVSAGDTIYIDLEDERAFYLAFGEAEQEEDFLV